MSIIAVYRGVPKPPVDFTEFDFAALPIDPRITFTRASAGTYFDSNGVMQTAAINEPRIDHDPVTGAVRGLLVEGQRTNIVTNSENLVSTFSSITNATITSGSGFATLTDDATSGQHLVAGGNFFTADGVTRAWSIDVKEGSARYFAVSHAAAFSAVENTYIFDTRAGVWTATTTNSVYAFGYHARNIGDGWWRIGFASNVNSVSYRRFTVGISSGPDYANVSYSGSGSTILVRRPQIEAGSFPTSHIPTSGTAMTRAADVSDAADITDIRLNPAEGTFLVEHDAPASRPLLSSGANLIAVSQGAGRLAVAYDGSGSVTYQNGVSTGSGAALSFDAGLRIGASASAQANACIRRARYYSRKLSPSEIAGVWA